MPELLKKLRAMPPEMLPEFAKILRQEIIDSVSRNGGHLASSCGCVELIMALHRVFNTPHTKIFFDVGHQAYAHKLLTGRENDFETLRRYNSISGFPTPAESAFDPAVSGHAGSALSAALGHCAAHPDSKEKVIVVIGDGAMGCGVNFEALNHAGTLPGSDRLIVILNDNRMSISNNVGTLSKVLNRVIAGQSYNKFRSRFKKLLNHWPRIKQFFSRLTDAGKSVFLPPALLFETLGFRYFGAIDGNNLTTMLQTFEQLKNIKGPLMVHTITRKGFGCEFASADPTKYHGIAGCDPDTGEMPSAKNGFSYEFSQAMLKLAEKNHDIVAVCPAMLEGTGLTEFAKKFPDRCFDTGITEAHAVTFAAGLATAGKLPVCACYDTFLQRALDEVYHDVALANLPVIFALDRSGAVADGPTHHGIYNCSFLRSLPNMTIMMPSSEKEMYHALQTALALGGPVVIRYPKGDGGGVTPEKFTCGKALIRRRGDDLSPVIWAAGAEVHTALLCAKILEKENLNCMVIDTRFLKPFDDELACYLTDRLQFTIEDHVISGGLYSALAEAVSSKNHRPIHGFGWNSVEVIGHGSVNSLRQKNGMTAEAIAEKIAIIAKKC